jgi:hypothetical protein
MTNILSTIGKEHKTDKKDVPFDSEFLIQKRDATEGSSNQIWS